MTYNIYDSKLNHDFYPVPNKKKMRITIKNILVNLFSGSNESVSSTL